MLPLPTQVIGSLTAKDLLEVVKTVFGELGAVVHPKTDLEAEAIASTIFNRADDINSARADAKATKRADEDAGKNREAKLRAFDDIQKHRAAYIKKLGSAAAYDVEFKARQGHLKAANAMRAETYKVYEAARDTAIERNSWLLPAKRDNDLTATALDVIEPPTQYEGTATGKKLYADFPAMNDKDRARNLLRWNAAMKAVAKVAGTPRAKRMNFVNMHAQADILKGGRPDAPKTRVVYGGNAFW
ncbi:MAG: hypothetical protein U0638_12595 [Phycisphaerales bacterium]